MLNKYLTIFDNHTDYEQFASDYVVRPNVSFCRDREKEVHYLYDAGTVKLYKGDVLVAEQCLAFGEYESSGDQVGYHFQNSSVISFSIISMLDKIEFDLRDEISNLNVVGQGNLTNDQFSYTYANNKITIVSEVGMWSNPENFGLYFTYKVNKKEYYSNFYINENK